MEHRTDLTWADMVVGCYVQSKIGALKLIDRHPSEANRFRCVDSAGAIHDIRLAGDTAVEAWVPDPVEAQANLLALARTDADAEKIVAMPIEGPARIWIEHLKTLHGIYAEPSMKPAKLRMIHESAHAQREFVYPHVHKEVS